MENSALSISFTNLLQVGQIRKMELLLLNDNPDYQTLSFSWGEGRGIVVVVVVVLKALVLEQL